MGTPTKDKALGKGKQLAGKAKETTSRWIGDDATAAEGRQEQVAGKVQETKGKAKAAVKKLVDKV
jgi:uncharacterized protein YjbJ (UPF0337 family)